MLATDYYATQTWDDEQKKLFFLYLLEKLRVYNSCSLLGGSRGAVTSRMQIFHGVGCLSPKFRFVLNSVSIVRLGHPEEMMITR